MGGMNEKTIDTPRQTATPGKATSFGKIRVHENQGEVHFHDDEKGLKVAVPAATFWKAWQGNVNLNSLTFFDSERNTICNIRFRIANSGQDVEAEVVLTKTAVNDTFKKLNDFALGK